MMYYIQTSPCQTKQEEDNIFDEIHDKYATVYSMAEPDSSVVAGIADGPVAVKGMDVSLACAAGLDVSSMGW